MIRRDLHDRLVNWAMHVRDVARQEISPTGRFCEQLAKRAGKGVWETTEVKRVVDEVDGDLVERAKRRCSQETKDMLTLLYVRRFSVETVCRRLRIPHRPKSVFDVRKYRAEHEIEQRIADEDALATARGGRPAAQPPIRP